MSDNILFFFSNYRSDLRTPYIKVIAIEERNNEVIFTEVATIKNASHVRLLSGSLVGCLVNAGDDSYPVLKDYESGDVYNLKLMAPETNPQIDLTKSNSLPADRIYVSSGFHEKIANSRLET